MKNRASLKAAARSCGWSVGRKLPGRLKPTSPAQRATTRATADRG